MIQFVKTFALFHTIISLKSLAHEITKICYLTIEVFKIIFSISKISICTLNIPHPSLRKEDGAVTRQSTSCRRNLGFQYHKSSKTSRSGWFLPFSLGIQVVEYVTGSKIVWYIGALDEI